MLKIKTLIERLQVSSKLNAYRLLLIPTLFLVFSFSGNKELKIGKKMPMADVKMESTTGEFFSLKDLKGDKGLIVVFSCNTCPFVVGNDNFPGWERQYNALHKKANEAGLELVLINSNEAKRTNEDSMEKMKTRASEQSYSMRYLVDPNSALADAFGAKTTPHIYVFDSSDKLIYKGAIDNTTDNQRTTDILYLDNVIDAVRTGSKIELNETAPRGCSIKRMK